MEQIEEFFTRPFGSVMLLLLRDVFTDRTTLAMAYGECPEALLPLERAHTGLFPDPRGRCFLDLSYNVG